MGPAQTSSALRWCASRPGAGRTADTLEESVLLPPASTQALPASLYYAKKPAWWPSGTAWPWAGPDLSPKVGTLPAKATSKAFDYYTGADASCTLNCGNYCCSVGASCSL